MSLTQVYLGLGSNIERELHLCAGLDALASFLTDMRCSAVFESQPVGIKSGPFFNLVVSAYTDLSLTELDRRLKTIEAENGRYAPDRVHPEVGKTMADLWRDAQIDQLLAPVAFEWQGQHLTPNALLIR